MHLGVDSFVSAVTDPATYGTTAESMMSLNEEWARAVKANPFIAIPGDIKDEGFCVEMVERTVRELGGVDMGPRTLWLMGAVLLLNLGFIAAFYKELKLTTFDAALASALGFAPGLVHYAFMTLVSVTAVGAFDAVGSILVVALMIAPPSAAYLLTDRLSRMIVLAMAIGVGSALAGYWMSWLLDVSIAGSMATMSGVSFTLAFFFAPAGR